MNYRTSKSRTVQFLRKYLNVIAYIISNLSKVLFKLLFAMNANKSVYEQFFSIIIIKSNHLQEHVLFK